MIQLKNVTYRYPDGERSVLDQVYLEVEEGEMLLVAGASGSGKSSLLRSLNGLIPHFHGGTISGQIRVAGRDPIALGPRGMSDQVGFVTQDPESHFVTRIVEDELAFVLENHGVATTVMRRRVEETLDQLAIAHLRQRTVDSLSGGERQRVAIASVLTLQPKVLVLDEPTSQLDPQSAEEVLTALRTLNEDLGLTVVFAEHRLERVAQHADRLLLLVSGEEPRLGPPGEVLMSSPLAPPLVRLAEALDWPGATLTIKDTRRRPEMRRLRQRLATAQEPTEQRSIGQDSAGRGASSQVAIEARGLWLTYPNGQEALTGLDLSVPQGSLTALLGRNGSGKSTLLKALVGLLKPDAGSIRLSADGKALDPQRQGLAEIVRWLGFVPQNPSRLLFHDSVTEELAWSVRQRSADGDSDIETSVTQLAAELGVDSLGEKNPRDLSTGERQRVALATALVGQPPILLLDEPTRGLDRAVKERLAAWLVGLRRRGVTILMATHDVELVAVCADRVVLLGEGRTVAAGPTREVLEGSPVFGSQVNKLLRDPRFHTVEDVLAALKNAPLESA